MTVGGLDTILNSISGETDALIEKIIADAKNEADRIIRTAEDEAKRISVDAEERSKALMNDIAERETASIEHEEKQKLLAEKQRILGKVTEKALKDIKADENKYFIIIKKLLKDRVGGASAVYMNSRDIKRMPDDIKALLSGSDAPELKADDSIESGFKLVCGDDDIVDNCTIDALAESQSDAIKEAVQRVLFA